MQETKMCWSFRLQYVPNRPFFDPKRRLSELSDQRHLL
jgi:hypothetical protein